MSALPGNHGTLIFCLFLFCVFFHMARGRNKDCLFVCLHPVQPVGVVKEVEMFRHMKNEGEILELIVYACLNPS